MPSGSPVRVENVIGLQATIDYILARLGGVGGSITLTGAVTGSGVSPVTTSISASGVVAGTYGDASNVPQIAIGADGRITSATNIGIVTGGTVSSVDASGGTTGFAFTGGPITTSGTLTLTVSNAATIRTAIGLSDMAVQNSGGVVITGGTVDDLSSLSVLGFLSSDHLQFKSAAVTADRTLTFDTGDTNRTLTIGASASVSGTNTGDQTLYNQTIEDEGTPVTQRSTINFVGSGVTVTDSGGKTTVTITGSGVSVGSTFIVDGGGTVITTGTKGYIEIPFNMTITAGRLFADLTGSIQVDIYKSNYAGYPPVVGNSITGGNPLKIISAKNSEDTTLSGWTTSVSAGDILAFNVDSCSVIHTCTVSLTGTRT